LNCSPDLSSPALSQWRYQYTIPVDALVIYYIDNVNSYKIYGNKIYTNLNNIDLIYRKSAQVKDIPEYFASVMKYSLASALAMPITKQKALVQFYDSTANRQLIQARHIDGSQQPNLIIQSSPLIDVRNRASSGSWYWCGHANN